MADCVKVAVRVRPLVPSEISKGSQEIIDVIENNNQVHIKNTEKIFTFNYAFDKTLSQDDVYNKSVKDMIKNLFKGYNVTILAYGQTGSGKTHTMGTNFSSQNDNGVIPSAVKQIFSFIRDNFCMDFNVSVSFIELYQEMLYDLLSEKNREQSVLEIREDNQKGIHVPGLTEVPVTSGEEVLQALTKGSAGRATASTNMNSQSSRSHAVFTIYISMQNKENCSENKTAKLQLVDLAGSERQKKTGAVGTTFKEGVNINKGLLALGNVISCLGDENKQGGFVPYRDSSLTRLLKDSLGGNSMTLMIACVSPADYNLEETLSTLRYADRARKIKNKPIVNEDPKLAEINQLKKTIRELKLQIIDGGNSICPAEFELLKKENDDLKLKVRDLTLKLSMALQDNTISMEKFIILQNANEQLQKDIVNLKEQYDSLINSINNISDEANVDDIKKKLLQFKEIQAKLNDITLAQENIEKEIRNHEDDTCHTSSSLSNSLDLSGELEEKHESHAAKQIEKTSQLKELSTKLILKERLAQQLIENMQNMAECTLVIENESKISALEKEKNELLQQLKAFQEGKAAENRRKRVQELEVQIQELKKKIQGQDRLIKMKENDFKRIETLKKEIMHMKQARVKLIRSMREDSDKFRQWKIQRERELAKLKQEDRKKQLQITQMKAMQTKQQNITKRKIEEAAALSKRLRDMMNLKKQVQETKHTGKVEKIGSWLKQEFEVYVGIVEAKATLKCLLEDRAMLQQQLDNSNELTEDDLKQLQEEIDMRSIQIQDLQQKILDSDEDTKTKNRFDNIQTMGEAKYALKSILEQTGDLIKKSVQNNSKLHELQDAHEDMKTKLDNCERDMKKLKEHHSQEMEQMQKDYEEKIAVLLQQINSKKIVENCEKCDKLEGKLRTIEDIALKNQTPKNQPVKKLNSKSKHFVGDVTYDIEENVISDDDIIEDDTENDPDWRKTPLGKRLLEEKRKFPKISSNLFGDTAPVKRSSDGGCTCKTNCSARCGCRKYKKTCTESCKCKPEVCANKNDENSDISSRSSTPTDSDGSFKKPRLVMLNNDDEEERMQRKRRLHEKNL